MADVFADNAALAAVPALRPLLPGLSRSPHELVALLGPGPHDDAALARRAGDPNADPTLLALLAGIAPAAFCQNPALPLLLLEDPAYPARFEPAAAGRLLSYAGVPRELLQAFAALGAPEAALAARLHVGLTGDLHDQLEPALSAAALAIATIPDDDLLAVLVALNALPPWLLARVAAADSPSIQAALAAAQGDWSALAALHRPATRPAAPVEAHELPALLEDESPAERALAAADPRTPPALLLATKEREDWTDVDYAVYEALAANPAAPPELLVALARDRSALNTRTRRAVALHPAAPPAALALLADEPYAAEIRLILAAHPNLAPSQRATLLANSLDQARETPDPLYRAIALSHPSAPPEVLIAHTTAPEWLERLAVALNPAAPAEVRCQLAEDGNRLVRAAARTPEPT